MLLPDPRALPTSRTFAGSARSGRRRGSRYRDAALDISTTAATRSAQLIDRGDRGDGIEILVKRGLLFTPEFDEKLAALKTPEARASEMEHAIRHEIHVRVDEDPAFYTNAARAARADPHADYKAKSHRRRQAARALRRASCAARRAPPRSSGSPRRASLSSAS
jgi:hypothetical protein